VAGFEDDDDDEDENDAPGELPSRGLRDPRLGSFPVL